MSVSTDSEFARLKKQIRMLWWLLLFSLLIGAITLALHTFV